LDLRQRIIDSVVDKAEKGEPLFLEERPPLGYVSTTSLEIDVLLGKPGIPLGRITEIKGWSQSGKSMLCCNIMGQCQKMGGEVVLIDTEGSYTSEWATKMGVNTSALIDLVPIMKIRSLEDTLRGIHAIVDAVDEDENVPTIVVVDSLAIANESEIEANYDDNQPGVHAKILSKAMRKLTLDLQEKRVGLVCVSQLRDRPMQFGSQTATLGGHAVGFHAALVIDMKRNSFLIEDNEKVGFNTRIRIDKSKLGGIPFAEREVQFYFDRGIDPLQSLLSVAVDVGVVQENRGWYSLEGEKKFRGSAWREHVSPDLIEKVKQLAFPGGYV
jgi:recombination protein RecA